MISLKTGKLYQLTHCVILRNTESSKAKWLWLDTGEIFMVIEKIFYCMSRKPTGSSCGMNAIHFKLFKQKHILHNN
jgi:hypothetical protein